MFNFIRPYASSSYALSEPLNEAIMSYSISPRQPLDYLFINRSIVDKYKLVCPTLNSNIFNK
jgi:hypothetical protein